MPRKAASQIDDARYGLLFQNGHTKIYEDLTLISDSLQQHVKQALTIRLDHEWKILESMQNLLGAGHGG